MQKAAALGDPETSLVLKSCDCVWAVGCLSRTELVSRLGLVACGWGEPGGILCGNYVGGPGILPSSAEQGPTERLPQEHRHSGLVAIVNPTDLFPGWQLVPLRRASF